jgi:nucleoid-associated protein YgaU
VLFLSLVGLSIVVVESLPAPRRAGRATAPARPAPPPVAPAEPVALLDGDVLVLRLGGPTPVGADAFGGAVLPPPSPAPPRAAAPEDASAPDTYVVQPGDTLSRIAQRELGSARLADELARLNGISDPSSLKVGQVLRLR